MSRGVALLGAFAGLLAPASAGASHYRGEVDGIKVEMQVSGGKILFARVATTLYCTPLPTRPESDRHTKPLRFYVGGQGGDATQRSSEPVRVGKRGGFAVRLESLPIEEDGFSELVFGGRISRRSASGHFRYRARYDEDCRTGGFQTAGGSDRGQETLHFEATRHSWGRSRGAARLGPEVHSTDAGRV